MHLPNGWKRTSLPEFTRIVMGQSPPSSSYNKSGQGLPFFQGKAEFGDLYPEVRKFCSEPNKIAELGATLLTVRAPVGPTNLANNRCCIGRGLAAIHPLDEVPEKFVLFLFRSRESEISGQGTGSTFSAINGQFLHDLEVPLPPLAEQKRIVSKIEELFSELDAGEESLRKAGRQLGVYRQSLLKQAFEGKLTAAWREQNPKLLETPEQLFARIQAERKARYEHQLKEWKIALKDSETNDEKKPPKPSILKPVGGSIAIFETPFPPEWNSMNLSQVALELGQGWSPKCLNHAADTTQWGVMKTTAIQPGRFQSESSKVLPSNFSPRPWLGLRHNDILITRAGPRSRCGVVCRVVGDHPKLLLCDKAYRLAFAQEVTSSEFVELLLCSPLASDAIEKLKTGINDSGVNITQTIFLQLVVPVPSLPEQQEIVRLLDEQFTVIEQNEREIATALKRSEALRQSILKKAFSGQLVAQDPADEPAGELLERIRKEREGASNTREMKSPRQVRGRMFDA